MRIGKVLLMLLLASPTITHIYTHRWLIPCFGHRASFFICFSSLRRDLHLPINPSPVAPREISRNLIGIQSFFYEAFFFSSPSARFHKINARRFSLFRHTLDLCVLVGHLLIVYWPPFSEIGHSLALFSSSFALLRVRLLFLPPISMAAMRREGIVSGWCDENGAYVWRGWREELE